MLKILKAVLIGLCFGCLMTGVALQLTLFVGMSLFMFANFVLVVNRKPLCAHLFSERR